MGTCQCPPREPPKSQRLSCPRNLLRFNPLFRPLPPNPMVHLRQRTRVPHRMYISHPRFNEKEQSDTHIPNQKVTHAAPFTGTYPEIEGNRYWATSLAGIPRSRFAGFRHPFLNYTKESLELLAKMGFLYDSSMSSGAGGDRVWPYTLDHGSVNDCLNQVNVCGKGLDAKGLWEVSFCRILGSVVLYCDLMDDFDRFLWRL